MIMRHSNVIQKYKNNHEDNWKCNNNDVINTLEKYNNNDIIQNNVIIVRIK